MANYYVSSVKFATFTAWSAGQAVSVGTLRRRTNLGTPRVFRCETAGTTGGAEPSWNITANSTTNDNGVVWRCISGVASYGWDSCLGTTNALGGMVNWTMSDICFLDSAHVEADVALSTLGPTFISVNAAGSVPPVKSDYVRGAKFTTTTSSGTLSIPKGTFVGCDFVFEHVSAAGTIQLRGTDRGCILKDCLLHLKTPNTSAIITATSTLGGTVELTQGTKIRFGGGAGQTIDNGNVSFDWNSSADNDTVSSDGAMPTALFNISSSSSNGGKIKCRGLNLSGFTGTRLVTSSSKREIIFENCLLADGVVYINGNAADIGVDGASMRLVDCSHVSTPVKQSFTSFELAYRRTMTSECVLSNSPDFGAGKLSDRIVIGASVTNAVPARGLVLKKWNDTVSSLTASIRGVYFGPTLPTKGFYSLDLSYPTDANNSLMVCDADPADVLDSGALTTDASDWTGAASARANSTAYAVGAFCKVSSNPGNIFICESSTGSSAASEPAGFATATPGSTVSDGQVTWRCGIGFKLEMAFTPARAGFIRGQAKLFPFSGTAYTTVLNNKLEVA